MEYFSKEWRDEMAKQERELQEMIFIDGDYLVVNVSYEYNVPLKDISTPELLLRLVHHLTEKTWMTQTYTRRLIEVAAHHFGYLK